MKRVRGRLAVLLVLVLAGLAVTVPYQGADVSTARAAEAEEALPPLAWTTHATDIGPNGALLLGEFNPRNHRTVVQFQFGRTKGYGRITPTYPKKNGSGKQSTKRKKSPNACARGRPTTTGSSPRARSAPPTAKIGPSRPVRARRRGGTAADSRI